MYTIIRDITEFNSVLIDHEKPIFCDTETCIDEGFTDSGLYGKIRLFQIYQEDWEKALLIDCFFVPIEKILALLKPQHLVFYNAAYDLHTINLTTIFTWLPKKLDDTFYLSKLKFFTKQKFTFYDSLDHAGIADEFILNIDKKESQKSDWSGPLSIKQKQYAAADVIYLSKLYNTVKTEKNSMVYSLDMTNLKLAVDYSRQGMHIDREKVTELKLKYNNELESILDVLPVNPRSSKQCCEYLKTSSSSKEVLVDLSNKGNEKAIQIKDARHCYKSLEFLNSYDRPNIKGFFNPNSALAGRFSCTGGKRFDHVNLQQIPSHLYKCIKAPEEFTYVYKDYSGLELRMATAFVGEPTMYELMMDGADLHTETGKFIFQKDEISDKERFIAKTLNFGTLFGGGVGVIKMMLQTNAGVYKSFKEVKSLINSWFDMYPGFRDWHNMHKHNFDVYGYMDIVTALGRPIRTFRLTDSLNFPIQGSSVEVTKVSLAMLKKDCPDAVIANVVHDSVTLLSTEEDFEDWGKCLDGYMIAGWKYVIQDLVYPDLIMPSGYKTDNVWDF